MLDFYLATATEVYALERPGDRLVDHLEPTRHPGLSFPDQPAALEWLYAESECLLACARQCAGRGELRRSVDLLMAAKDLAESGANSRQYELAASALQEVAQAAEDAHAEGRARVALTLSHMMAGRYEQADQEARSAMLLGLATEDPVASSWPPNDRGIIAFIENRNEDAEAHYGHALTAWRALGNRNGEASVLCNLARVHINLGRSSQAVGLTEQALAIYQEMDNPLRLANGLYAHGLALNSAGRPDDALTRLGEALALFREGRQRLWEGMTHLRLAEVHLAAHHPAEAAAHAEEVLALRGIGGEWRRGTVLTVLGRALKRMGQADRARACWQEALAIFERLGSSEAEEVRTLLLSPAIAA